MAQIEKNLEQIKNQKQIKKLEFDNEFKQWQQQKLKKKEEVKMQLNHL